MDPLVYDAVFWLWLGGSIGYFAWRRYRWGLLGKANDLLKEAKYSECLEYANKAIRRFPRDWAPRVTAAAACLNLDRDKEAIQYCDEAEALDGRHFQIYLNRSLARSALCDYDGALVDAEKAVALSPGTASALIVRATAHIRCMQYEKALSDADAALLKNPKSCSALLNRAVAYGELNDLDRAETNCIECLKHVQAKGADKVVAAALLLQASLYAARGKLDRAIEEVSQAIELSPNQPYGYVNRAFFWCILKDLDKAATDLDRAESVERNSAMQAFIYSNRARIFLMKNDIEKASEFTDRALSLLVRPGLLCTRAALHLRQKNLEEASNDIEAAIKMDHHYVESYWFKGQLLRAQGRDDEATANEEKALGWGYQPYF